MFADGTLINIKTTKQLQTHHILSPKSDKKINGTVLKMHETNERLLCHCVYMPLNI